MATLTIVRSSTDMKLALARTRIAMASATPVSVSNSPSLRAPGADMALPLLPDDRHSIGEFDFRVHRQADAQRMRRQFLRIERNAHRQALHHLDPVAGRVLRRDDR